MESMNDNSKLHSNDKKDRLKLGDAPSQEILEDQKVIQGKSHILIAIVIFCILYYTKN